MLYSKLIQQTYVENFTTLYYNNNHLYSLPNYLWYLLNRITTHNLLQALICLTYKIMSSSLLDLFSKGLCLGVQFLHQNEF
jgi:hypothetical protein